MLIYKINDKKDTAIRLDGMNDYSYMLKLVMEDYNNYFRASTELQCRYDFALQSIYSCLSKVNNDDNRLNAYRELSKFLNEVRNKAGINMQIIKGEKLSVKEKPKIKMKKFMRGLI